MGSYSIGITTFAARFHRYLVPLVVAIKEAKPDVEIILTVNGEKDSFDQLYRTELLNFVADYNNVYLTMFPRFRSLAKLWNTCLINSTNMNVLVLNDDVTVGHEFFKELDMIANDEMREASSPIFKINGSWSHSFLNRKVVDKVGWFDERYLGIGEEDGDFEWRIGKQFGYKVPSIMIRGIVNHVDHSDCLAGMNKVNSKYSQFNYDFAFNHKYEESAEGENFGIMNRKLKCLSETPEQYGCEEFYWRYKCEL